MKYEYNGHLELEDRINLVANEITSYYSFITTDIAKKVALLEGSISTPCTANMILRRLYNIMLLSRTNKTIVSLIFNDYKYTIASNKNINHEYVDMLEEINSFLNNNTSFPFLSDYYSY